MKEKKKNVSEEAAAAAAAERAVRVSETVTEPADTAFLIYHGVPVTADRVIDAGRFLVKKYQKPEYKTAYEAKAAEITHDRDRAMDLEMQHPELIVLERLNDMAAGKTRFKRRDVRGEPTRHPAVTEQEREQISLFFLGIQAVNGLDTETVSEMTRYLTANWRRVEVTEIYQGEVERYIQDHGGEKFDRQSLEQPWIPLMEHLTGVLESKQR